MFLNSPVNVVHSCDWGWSSRACIHKPPPFRRGVLDKAFRIKVIIATKSVSNVKAFRLKVIIATESAGNILGMKSLNISSPMVFRPISRNNLYSSEKSRKDHISIIFIRTAKSKVKKQKKQKVR